MKRYFCTEPWVGMFTIQTNQDVTFCPCYLQMKIGNLKESSIQEVWNAEPLVQLRRSFSEGVLPEPCKGQLCPVAVGADDPNLGLLSHLLAQRADDASAGDAVRRGP